MKVVLTDHVATNLYLRNIDGFKAISTVKSPSWQGPGKGGKLLAQRDFDGRTLEVVYAEERNKKVIITAYYVD